MRRQRPLRYTLALFATAVGIVASPAALVAAEDGATPEPHGPVQAPAGSAPKAPVDQPPEVAETPDSQPVQEPTPDPTTAPTPTTAPPTVPPTATTTPTVPPTATTTTTLPTTTPEQADAARDGEPTSPDITGTTLGPEAADADELDGPIGIDGITRAITFPVLGPVSYSNDWGACRDGCARHHQGTDILGVRMQPLLAAVDGTVTRVRLENAGTAGVVISVTGDDGWYYNYFHVNDDTPGTDDGLADPEWQISPGLTVGSRVRAGQVIGYMGDSGNAESSVPHLHFEIRTPDRTPANPYASLVAAQRTCATGPAASTIAEVDTLSPSAVAVIPLAGGGRWVIDRDGRLYAEGPAARVQPAAGVDCDDVVRATQAVSPPPLVALADAVDVPEPVDVPLPVDVPVQVDVPVEGAPASRRWTVEAGDCLWDIVQTSYGTFDADATVALVDFVFEHNHDRLTSPSVLPVGATLELPPLTF